METQNLYSVGFSSRRDFEQSNVLLKFEKNNTDNVKNESEKTEREFAEGIKTLKLINGKLIDINDLKREEENEDEENGSEGNENEKKNLESETEENINTRSSQIILKSRHNLKKFLNECKVSNQNAVKKLQIISIGLLLIYLSLGISTYVIKNSDFNGSIEKYFYAQKVALRYSEFVNFLQKSNKLKYLANGILLNTNPSYDSYNITMSKMISSFEKMNNYQTWILSTLNKYHFDVSIVFPNSSSIIFPYNTASELILTKANNLINLPFANFTNNPDLAFLEENILNDLGAQTISFLQQLFAEQESICSNHDNTALIIFVLSVIIQFISIFIILPIYSIAKFNQISILKIFLEIPQPKVLSLKAKSEEFLSQIQIGQEDDAVDSESDGQIYFEDELNSVHFGRKKKSRKFKMNSKSQKIFFIQFLACVLIIESFFIANYQITTNYGVQLKSSNVESNTTTLATFYFHEIYVGAAARFFNNSATVFKSTKTEAITKTLDQIDDLFNMFQLVILIKLESCE